MPVIHWVATAVNTYILHTEHGNGYQWWSGIGLGTSIGVNTWHRFKVHNCQAKWWCWRFARHIHPEDGKYVCPKHHPDFAA